MVQKNRNARLPRSTNTVVEFDLKPRPKNEIEPLLKKEEKRPLMGVQKSYTTGKEYESGVFLNGVRLSGTTYIQRKTLIYMKAGLPVKDVARELGIAIGTVWGRINRMRRWSGEYSPDKLSVKAFIDDCGLGRDLQEKCNSLIEMWAKDNERQIEVPLDLSIDTSKMNPRQRFFYKSYYSETSPSYGNLARSYFNAGYSCSYTSASANASRLMKRLHQLKDFK